jgi:hypothetical protein
VWTSLWMPSTLCRWIRRPAMPATRQPSSTQQGRCLPAAYTPARAVRVLHARWRADTCLCRRRLTRCRGHLPRAAGPIGRRRLCTAQDWHCGCVRSCTAGTVSRLRRRRGSGCRLASRHPRSSAAGSDGRLRWRRAGPPRHSKESVYLRRASLHALCPCSMCGGASTLACVVPTTPAVSRPPTTQLRPHRPPQPAHRELLAFLLCSGWCGWHRITFAAAEGQCVLTGLWMLPTLCRRI